MVNKENPLTVQYFRNLLKSERDVLEGHCSEWREICKLDEVPQNFEGDILVAIGQAELLMRERFAQFSGLIDNCEFKLGEKETTCQDLQGFWDIVYFQVEGIQKKFLQLKDIRLNNWELPKPKSPAKIKKKFPAAKPLIAPIKTKTLNNGGSGMRAHILAARQRLKEAAAAKNQEAGVDEVIKVLKPSNEFGSPLNVQKAHQDGIKSPDKAVFDAGFFKVVTPVKKMPITPKGDTLFSPASTAKVLSSAVLRERMQNSNVVHKDYSPCMRITRSMKTRGLGTKLDFNKENVLEI